MTEKLDRRGLHVRTEYAVDHLANLPVKEVASTEVVALNAADPLGRVRSWLASGAGGATHQGFPVLDDEHRLVGVLTRRDIIEPSVDDWIRVDALIRRAPAVAYEDNSVREAADHMVMEQVGRLPVVSREDPHVVVGMISRSDLLSAHRSRLKAMRHRHRVRLTTFWSEL